MSDFPHFNLPDMSVIKQVPVHADEVARTNFSQSDLRLMGRMSQEELEVYQNF